MYRNNTTLQEIPAHGDQDAPPPCDEDYLPVMGVMGDLAETLNETTDNIRQTVTREAVADALELMDLFETWTDADIDAAHEKVEQKRLSTGSTASPDELDDEECVYAVEAAREYREATAPKTVEHIKPVPPAQKQAVEAPHTETAGEPVNALDQFAINGQVAQMKQQMIDDIPAWVWALLGQLTILFMVYNAGKTLVSLWEIINGIIAGRLIPENIYYINADDTFKGGITKGEIAEKYGFKMLIPGHNGFKADQLLTILSRLTATGKAAGIVIILDTGKKFIDMMDKAAAARATEILRQFVSHGGTVIILAHVNKHRGADGKPIHEGTGDLVNDADCVYVGDILLEDTARGLRTIQLKNIKARGDVPSEITYRYSIAKGASYEDRLQSIVEVGKAEQEAAKRMKTAQALLAKNKAAILAIKECLMDGINQKTALIEEAHSRSGLSRSVIRKALEDHTGGKVDEYQFWHLTISGKNSNIYQLNYGVSTVEGPPS